ncbi:MAG: sulfoxide reductase heme-binding subunit YedZ [Gemmatimonadales bacterium]|nr:sulfoxide reductase heme-binding subunit YedZ [Gemmatimonadales bacterium]NIN11305.1 sulfoxide reductase heme-binding subunit YedZ [Gemmatimonadales bacterium]NIN49904.1 sulfoxide reductase heme-binding subunit YedZ [Gemmatimonadales bacterium]NIP07368.1 sulfoxide reductase heme-binding subunit YedZ [Gemmatimonadales bacterium]NIR03063.1 sulfoxide reductase heme-binding subunit YedZ [Gemmatimonadales bacterium]
MTQGQWVRRVVRPAAVVAALVPAVLLLRAVVTDNLGANPVEEITHRTGFAAITLLMITLAVTPAGRLLRFGALVQLRRMLGLFAFFYASLHFATYALDQTYLSGLGVSPSAIAEDIAKRPYVTVGFTTFLLLVPLAVTSTRGWVKRLGGKRWQRLHRLVYVAGAGAVLHFLWLVKADVRQPVIYGVVLVVLLGYRLVGARLGSRRAAPRARRSASEPTGARG